MASNYRRARRGLVCGVLAFFVSQFALAYVIQYHRPAWHDPVYGAKAERLAAKVDVAPQGSRSVVFLGSSRTACGVWGREVESAFPAEYPVTAFNFGVTSAGPILEGMTFERLRARGIPLDVVVIEVLPALLTCVAEGGEISVYPPEHFTLREHDYARRWGVRPERLADLRLGSILWPSYTHRVCLLEDLAPVCLPGQFRRGWAKEADNWGNVANMFPRNPGPEARASALRLAHGQYHPIVSQFALGGQGTSALRELLGRCRDANCQVVLLWMPEGSTFRSWYRPGAREETLDFLAGLQREFGCSLINAQAWMPEEAFLDSHHLLGDTASSFSQRLGRELRTILCERLPAPTNGQADAPTNR